MKPLRMLVAVMALAWLLPMTGCYRMITKEAKREYRWKKRMAKGPDGVDGAVRSARSLVKVPLTRKPEHLFRYRMMAMRAIGFYMESRGYDEELDLEAHRYYEEALELGDPNVARLELARLYARTGRRGKMGEIIADGPSSNIAGVDYELAIMHWRASFAKGDLAGSELAWHRAETLAKTLYDVEVAFPKDFGASGNIDASGGKGGLYLLDALDWRARHEVLRERMFMIASPHDSPTGRAELAEIVRLWSQYERIGMRTSDDLTGKTRGDTYRTYLDGARIFAIAKDDAAAKTLLEIAGRAAMREPSEFRRADLTCTHAFVATHAERSDDAKKAAHKCLTLARRSKRGLAIDELVVLGEALESAGELAQAETIYLQAIERAERQRESYPVAERTVFFRTSVRRGYWGLARTLARRSQQAGQRPDPAAFSKALQAIELVRARQLGELLQGSGKRLGKFETLADLQARLRDDDVVLAYVAMDDRMLLFAVTKAAHDVRFIDLDADTLAHTTARITAGLSTPTSDAADLDRLLTLLGRALVLPVHELVAGKRRIVVLPDGALNAVPFDLLDLETAGYHPLVESTDVEVTPSLAFLLMPQERRAATGLFGMADPTYGTIPDAPTPDDATRVAARAARAGYFAALPETRRELESIAGLLGGQKSLWYGNDARESVLAKSDLSGYGIVHFATHGILGRDVPGIDEPALVLAAEPGQDGFLTASEASKLRLDARLTVLSACKTGAGDAASGEGVLGMSRAFMIAGSSSVLVSLWSVDSLATEALMVEFYRRLASGEAPTTALRAAKLAVRDGTTAAQTVTAPALPIAPPKRKSKRRPEPEPTPEPPPAERRDHPYYWGAFILVGR